MGYEVRGERANRLKPVLLGGDERRKTKDERRRARLGRRPLQGIAAGAFARGAFWLGGLALTRFRGPATPRRGKADFVGGFIAGAFKGAPHVPTGDGAIGAPALTESEELFGLWHVLLAVGNGPAFFYAEVVDGEHVGAAEAEDEEHLDGPSADPADADEALAEFLIGHGKGLLEGGHNARERIAR